MKASSHCRPASWYIHSLSAACGDVWQTHCMHAVTIQVPLWVFLIRGACFMEWLEKRVLYYTVWAQNISGFLPKCPSPLCATRVLSDRAGRATYSNPPPPLVGDEEWAHAFSETYRSLWGPYGSGCCVVIYGCRSTCRIRLGDHVSPELKETRSLKLD